MAAACEASGVSIHPEGPNDLFEGPERVHGDLGSM